MHLVHSVLVLPSRHNHVTATPDIATAPAPPATLPEEILNLETQEMAATLVALSLETRVERESPSRATLALDPLVCRKAVLSRLLYSRWAVLLPMEA